MAKMSMRVILKSGAEFTVKCDKFTLERNGLEQVTGWQRKPLCSITALSMKPDSP